VSASIGFEPIDLGADETALLSVELARDRDPAPLGKLQREAAFLALGLPSPGLALKVRSIVGPNSGSGMPAYWLVRNAFRKSGVQCASHRSGLPLADGVLLKEPRNHC
jgi:hypothetical protein